MKLFNQYVNEQEVISEIRRILEDLPEAKLCKYDKKEYEALNQVTERIRFDLPNHLAFEFYIERAMDPSRKVPIGGVL